VVVSRTGICINKADGSVASGKTLNVTNIPRGGTPANQIPAFYLFNDSEGNMLGATIPVLAGVFNIYKWTSVDDDPILLYSGTSSNGDARKMAAVGDINGHAFIYDLITDSPTGDYRQWEVIGGAIQPVNTFTTNVPAFSFQHIIAPLHVTADPAFFCVSRLLNGAGGPSVNVLYKNETGTLSEIQPSAPHQYNGSGTYTYYGGKEWGGLGTSACTAFWFDGQAYGVILTQSWYASIVSIIDATPAHNYLLVDIVDDYTRDESERDNYIRIDNFNGNLTAGTCYEIAPDGKTVWVYTLFTGESVKCYKMTI
jgi:hypothetical protein